MTDDSFMPCEINIDLVDIIGRGWHVCSSVEGVWIYLPR